MIGRWRHLRMLAVIGAFALGLGAAPVRAQPAEPSDDRRQILVLLRLPAQHYRLNADYGGDYGDDLTQSARRRIAKRIARHHGLTLVNDWPMPLLGLDCFIMAVPDGETVEAAAAQVSRDGGVDWAQPMHRYQVQGEEPTHNDPLFQAQPVAREWRLADLHQLATGRGVTVAVIDSRVDAAHPDLVGQMATMQDFAPDHPAGPELHGTGVAGIIAAKADNGLGIAGVAPRAQLMGLRACWQSLARPPATVCDSLSLARALHFAIEHKAQVINLSLSGPPDMLLGRLIDLGLHRGAAVVAAFDRSQPDGGFPASQPGVIAVA
ncbi:MAG TPA: S8 family serine peptidase, partial [Sphingomonas sp.]|nr:S8 family serine peptidase [Sphingomonas sp.]